MNIADKVTELNEHLLAQGWKLVEIKPEPKPTGWAALGQRLKIFFGTSEAAITYPENSYRCVPAKGLESQQPKYPPFVVADDGTAARHYWLSVVHLAEGGIEALTEQNPALHGGYVTEWATVPYERFISTLSTLEPPVIKE